jgi:hypothetical protein
MSSIVCSVKPDTLDRIDLDPVLREITQVLRTVVLPELTHMILEYVTVDFVPHRSVISECDGALRFPLRPYWPFLALAASEMPEIPSLLMDVGEGLMVQVTSVCLLMSAEIGARLSWRLSGSTDGQVFDVLGQSQTIVQFEEFLPVCVFGLTHVLWQLQRRTCVLPILLVPIFTPDGDSVCCAVWVSSLSGSVWFCGSIRPGNQTARL